MHRARVRSLYDSEAVLRRLAVVLRTLGAEDVSPPGDARQPRDPAGANTAIASAPSLYPSVGRAAFLGALRRSRELLEALDRTLAARGRAQRTSDPKAASR